MRPRCPPLPRPTGAFEVWLIDPTSGSETRKSTHATLPEAVLALRSLLARADDPPLVEIRGAEGRVYVDDRVA
ncbi:MAG: hypothetical protein AAF928_12160 [Myxococcota bacterium]